MSGPATRTRAGRTRLVPFAGGLLVPADLLEAITGELQRQVERARGEYALLATDPSPAAAVGRAREQQWRAMYPALAELHDHLAGGAR